MRTWSQIARPLNLINLFCHLCVEEEGWDSKGFPVGRDEYIRRLVFSLTIANLEVGLRNPYLDPVAAHNLQLFLTSFDPAVPTLLLVGEAPGYRGAAQSGVPLCSLAVLLDDWGDPWNAFGPEVGYGAPDQARFWREATASMVWTCLAEILRYESMPVTWNALPFHPAARGDDSNAPLASKHVRLGRPWLEAVLELFPNALPVAVGRKAAQALTDLGIAYMATRHPSHGGKLEFAAGVESAVAHLTRRTSGLNGESF